MNFGALIIGDEILSGRRSDKHLAKLIELLGARGLKLSWARYAGDDFDRLADTLRQTFATGDVVFSFGGIGATPDDRTREAAGAALGLELALHPEAEAEIRARFGAEITPERLQMGVYPVGSEIIPNSFNRIPGFSIRQHYFTPGFPVMAFSLAAHSQNIKGFICLEKDNSPVQFASVGLVIATTIVHLLMYGSDLFYCLRVLKIRPRFKNMPFGIMKELVAFSAFVFLRQIFTYS